MLPLAVFRHALLSSRFVPMLFALCAVGGGEASAAGIMWTGASNSFLSAGNWTGLNMPPNSGDSLIFGAAGAGGLLLNNNLTSGAFNVAGLTFNAGAGAFVIGDGTATANAGNAFALTGDVANNSTSLQTINNPFSVAATRTFTTTAGGGNLALGGTISGGAGITAAGAGTLTLSGNNSYAGGATVSQGTLVLNSNTAAGGFAAGVITLGDGATGSSSVELDFGSGIGIGGADLVLRGGNAVRRVNPITVANTGSAGAATLGFTGSVTTIYTDLTLNRAVVFTSNSATKGQRVFMGQISGPGAGAGNDSVIIDSGAGNWLVLYAKDTGSASVANTFTGNLRVKTGNLELGGVTYISDTAVNENLSLPATASVTVDGGATLQFVWGSQTFDALNGGGTILRNTTDLQGTKTLTIGSAGGSGSFSGTINSLFNLTKTGAGTQILSGANTYTGTTTVNAGTLQAANSGALSTTSAVAVNNAGTRLVINYGWPSDYTQAQVPTLLAKTTFGATTTVFGFDTTNAVGPVTYGNALAMAAGLTKLGAGTLVLSASNTYGGATLISAGTLQVGDGGTTGSLPAGSAITNHATLAFNRTDTVTQGIDFASGIGGSGGVTQQGSGTLIFTGLNTYPGATAINAGTLSLTGTLNGGTAISTSGTGVLSQTSTGGISGASSLTLGGNGTSILAGANTYAGATTINGGTLLLTGTFSGGTAISTSGTGALSQTSTGGISGASSLTLGGNGTSALAGANTYTSATAINGGTLSLTGTLSGGTAISTSGTGVLSQTSTGGISGASSLTVGGSGTSVLAGTNTYNGGTTISGATLQLGTGGTTGSIPGNVTNNGSLVFLRSDAFVFNGVISGNGGVIQQGSGSLTLGSTPTYTGSTLVNTGTLQLTGALGNTATTVATNAFLSGEGSIGATGSLTFNGGSSLRVDGSTAGALTVGGNLMLNGTVSVVADVVPAGVQVGKTFRVLNYGGMLTGSGANFASTTLRNPVFSTATPGQVNVSFDNKALTWFGSAAPWDLNTTANWNAGADKFFTSDAVTFSDTGTIKGVTVNTALAPTSVAFTNTVGNNYTLSGTGSIAGSVSKNGAGVAAIGVPIIAGSSITVSAGTLTLSGAKPYTGATAINGGTLSLTGTLTGGTPISTSGTGVLSQTSTGGISGASSLAVGGIGTSILAGANTYTGATTISGNGATLSLTGTLSGGGDITMSNGGILSQTSTGVISGASTLTFGGAGTSILAGANTYTGNTNINQGTLSLSGSLAESLINTGGGVLLQTSTGSIGGSKPFVLSGAGTSILAGANTYSGPTAIVATTATLQLGDGGTTGSLSPSSVFLSGGGTLAFNRSNTVTQGVDFASVIADNISVSQRGSGTLILNGANTYPKATTVTAGTLVVDGSIATSSGVSVSIGGKLSGHGIVSALSGAGLIDPVLEILTGTKVDPSGGLDFAFGFTQPGAPTYGNASASGNDVLHLTDATPFVMSLNAANVVTVDFSGATLSLGQTYRGGFFTDAAVSGSLLSGATFLYTGLTGVAAQYNGLVTQPSAAFATGTVTNGMVMQFTIVAVPEPGSASLALLGGLGLLLRRRRSDGARGGTAAREDVQVPN